MLQNGEFINDFWRLEVMIYISYEFLILFLFINFLFSAIQVADSKLFLKGWSLLLCRFFAKHILRIIIVFALFNITCSPLEKID